MPPNLCKLRVSPSSPEQIQIQIEILIEYVNGTLLYFKNHKSFPFFSKCYMFKPFRLYPFWSPKVLISLNVQLLCIYV